MVIHLKRKRTRNFNSSMVRLKGVDKAIQQELIEFQFLYGAIKRGRGDFTLCWSTKISIPLWCD